MYFVSPVSRISYGCIINIVVFYFRRENVELNEIKNSGTKSSYSFITYQPVTPTDKLTEDYPLSPEKKLPRQMNRY